MQRIFVGAGLSPIVICRAAGVQSGNVYTTLAGAAAAARAFGPGATLLIDGNVTADAGVIDLDLLGGIYGFGLPIPTITINEGTTFTAATKFDVSLRGVNLAWTGSSPPFNINASALFLRLIEYVSLSATNVSTNGMVAGIGGSEIIVSVGFGCAIVGSSGHPVVSLDVDSIARINVLATIPDIEGSIVEAIAANSITGGASGAYTICDTSSGLTVGRGAASISPTQAGTTAINYI